MQVRFTTSLGMAVTEEETLTPLGTIAGIVIHPDTGKVEGFFVAVPGFLSREQHFLSTFDILRWGTRVYVRDADVLGPFDDRVRLQSLTDEGRPFLGQPIVTESGRPLGRCADVQFHTSRFEVEWFFPRRWGIWGTPLPLSQVIEVRKDAILVREPAAPLTEPKQTEGTIAPPLLDQMPDAA